MGRVGDSRTPISQPVPSVLLSHPLPHLLRVPLEHKVAAVAVSIRRFRWTCVFFVIADVISVSSLLTSAFRRSAIEYRIVKCSLIQYVLLLQFPCVCTYAAQGFLWT